MSMKNGKLKQFPALSAGYGFFFCSCLLSFGLLLLSSCSSSPEKAEKDFMDFINRHEEMMAPCAMALQEARHLHDERAFTYLSELRASGLIQDPYLHRQLEILYRDFLPCQVPLEWQDSIVSLELKLKSWTISGLVDSGMQEADHVLRNSDKESELEKAWLYIKSSGVEKGRCIKELVRLRNQAARRVGFENYFDMALFLEEQQETCLDSLFHDLELKTESAYIAMRARMDSVLFPKRRLEKGALRPWLLRGKFFRLGQRAYGSGRDDYYSYVSMENVVLRFFSSINLDLSDVFGKSMISSQSVYLPWLECLDMDRRQDIRIIGHLSGTESDMQMLLAMAAEAAYCKNISNTLPSLLRKPSSSVISCGISAFFARMAAYPNWVLSMGIFSAGQSMDIQETSLLAMRQDQLFTCRWWMLVYYFEKSMYENPEADPDAMWRDLFARYLKIESGEDRIGNSDWAVENYFSLYAVHAHNFIMGELWASQWLEHLCQNDSRLGKVENPNVVGDGAVGKYLRKYIFQSGASVSWQELTVSGTGAPLANTAFLHQFAD